MTSSLGPQPGRRGSDEICCSRGICIVGREAGRHDLPQTKSPPTRNRQRPSFASSTSNPTDLFQYRIPRMTSVTVMSQSRCHSAYPERNHHDRHSKCSCRASNRDSTWTSIARRRALIAGATGNIVEWFDFTIYGFTAAVLATVFFPPEFGSGALLATFALYGVAFLARPAGGIFFGRLGDRLGRRRSLSLAITLMGCSTAAIGSYRPTLRSVLQHRCCCCSVAWFKDSRPAANTPERQPSSSSMRRLTAEACTRDYQLFVVRRQYLGHGHSLVIQLGRH